MTEDSKIELEKTGDGSYTLIKNGNRMHTDQGAIKESKKKYVEPMLKHIQRKKHEKIRILDIGTGIGYNALLTKKLAEKNNIKPVINTVDKKSYKKQINKIENNTIIEEQETPEINKHEKDARKYIKNHPKNKKYHAIYLDPFPPKQNPELYSAHFLSKLRELLKEDGILLTYNASYACRAGLIFSGFNIYSQKKMGKQMTIATKQKYDYGEIEEKNELMLGLTDIGIPYIDPELNWSRKKLKKVRWNLRKNARHKKLLSSSNKCPNQLKDPTEKRKKDLSKFGITEEELKKLTDIKKKSTDKILELRRRILNHKN